jgi:hypothetical protein
VRERLLRKETNSLTAKIKERPYKNIKLYDKSDDTGFQIKLL